MILVCWILRKFDTKIFQICLHHLSDVVTFLPLKLKKLISTVLFINTSDYLSYLRRKQTVMYLPAQPENVTTLTCEMQNYFIWLEVCCVFFTLEALKIASCGVSSMALQRTIRYDTIRDAILTCARKPTWVSLIYRTEPTTKKCKTEKLKSKTNMLRRKQSGESMWSLLMKKGRLRWEGFAEK